MAKRYPKHPLPDCIPASELSTLDTTYQLGYVEHPDRPGWMYLVRGAREQIIKFETELDELQAESDGLDAEHTRQIAELEARRVKYEAAQTAWKTETIQNRLTAQFKAAGVNVHLAKAAILLLKDQYSFEVEDGIGNEYCVVARNADTGHTMSLENVVEDFLDSDEGAGFLPKPRIRSDNMFTEMLADLKHRH